ncbi:MAG: hypothetical protein KDI12_00780, partial [Anaerolineae bacterium]|nr:hypothetical protein [Anaerolineae bacterium]
SDGSPLRWGIPKSALSVSTHTGYSEQAAGLVDVVNNHTPALLNSTYPSAPDDSVVTILFARDDHYISTAMGDVGPGTVTVNDATGEISVGLGGTHVTTYSTLNWAPFTKTADGWIAADVYPTVDNLVTQLDSVITDADLTALSGGVTPDDLDMARRGAISVAQNYYLASFMGRSNVTAVDGTPVNDAWIDDADLTLGSGEEPVVVLNQVILDSYQLFFLKSSVTTLDGELVSSTVFEVPSTATVLQNLGEMALNWDTPVSALKSVKTPLKYFLKEYYKQQGLILKTNISIGKIAKNASRYVAALSIAIQAFTIIYDFYPDSMVVQLVTDSLVILSETMSAFSAFTAIWHYYNAVSLAQSAVLKGIQLNLTISASVTLAIGIAVAVGAFLYVVFTNDLSPGSIAYNMAVAALVAQIIVAVLLAILAFSVVGTAFVAVLALIDAILYLICRVENHGDNSIFCTGITGQVARALAEAFYKVDPIVKLGKKDRLQFAFDNLELVDKQMGFTVNNQLALSVTVTNTIALDDKLFFSGTNDSPGNSQYRDDAAQKLNNSTFAYFLQQSPVNQHAGLEFNQVNWTRLNSEKYQAVFTADNTFDLSTAGIGINSGLPLYMTEALLVKYMECTYAVLLYTCDFGKEFRTSVHLDWTGNLRFDLFPATFGQFYSLVSAGLSGGNAYRFSWDSRFPALQDADGDGLRNQAFEGADPNDLTADSDGDGLYDFWEVKNGTDPLRVDDDCDGLSDYWEVFHQLDPWAPDSDGDGLLDGE